MDIHNLTSSYFASLFGIVHWLFSRQESVWTSPMHPNPRHEMLCHTQTFIYLHQNKHHTYLSWHFHSHSEIYCHANPIVIWLVHSSSYCFAWSYRADLAFVAKPPFIILLIHVMQDHCTSWYIARGIHIESYRSFMICKWIKVWWSSLLEHCPMWGKKRKKKEA